MSALQSEINDRRDALTVRLFPNQENVMSTADLELRERCLTYAIGAHLGDPVQVAAGFFDFVKGKQSPREKIDAALDQAGVS